MPELNIIQRLRRRLAELGCPGKVLRRIVRETSEHLEDLERAALAQGLTAEAAAKLAEEQLGNPEDLAERHVDALRSSSRWARMPLFYFGVLPPLIAALLGVGYYSLNGGWIPGPIVDLMENWCPPWFFFVLNYLVCLLVACLTALLSYLFCHRVRSLGLRLRWMWLAGGLLAANGLFLHVVPSRDSVECLAYCFSVRESLNSYLAHSVPGVKLGNEVVFPKTYLPVDANEIVRGEGKTLDEQTYQKLTRGIVERQRNELDPGEPAIFSSLWQILGVHQRGIHNHNEDFQFFDFYSKHSLDGFGVDENGFAAYNGGQGMTYDQTVYHQLPRWTLTMTDVDVTCPMPLITYGWPNLNWRTYFWAGAFDEPLFRYSDLAMFGPVCASVTYAMFHLFIISAPLLVPAYMMQSARRQMKSETTKEALIAIPS